MDKIGNALIEQSVVHVKGNMVSNMGEEKVMLSIANGKYYNLGEVGGAIWDLIEEKISIIQLVEKLISIYKIEKSECEEQVLSFLENLWNEGLIEITG